MFRVAFVLSCSLWTFVYAINVMPVGDSLTIGCGSVCGGFDCRIDTSPPCAPCSGGYREPLWHMLNYSYPGSFSFVGSRNNGPEWMGNDTSHEGYIGYSVSQLTAKVTSWGKYSPDVLLLLTGANDIATGANAAMVQTALHTLLSTVASTLPETYVFVGTLPSLPESNWQGVVAEVNKNLPILVSNFKNATVVPLAATQLCDQDKTACCPDWTNPVNAGYALLASAWFSSIHPLFAV